MSLFVYLAIFIFTSLLFYMSVKSGTQTSISQLAKNHWIILLIALCSQCLLLYPVIELTPIGLQWLPFIGCFSIIITGITNVFKKEDEVVHMIAALISFITFTIWILLLNPIYILPLIICIAAGKKNIKWRIEVGLIISVYMILLSLL